jgi:hypothetical protein
MELTSNANNALFSKLPVLALGHDLTTDITLRG